MFVHQPSIWILAFRIEVKINSLLCVDTVYNWYMLFKNTHVAYIQWKSNILLIRDATQLPLPIHNILQFSFSFRMVYICVVVSRTVLRALSLFPPARHFLCSQCIFAPFLGFHCGSNIALREKWKIGCHKDPSAEERTRINEHDTLHYMQSSFGEHLII